MKQLAFTYIAISLLMVLTSMQVRGQLVTTIAGQVEVLGDTDGQALTKALFNNPHSIAIDAAGNIYIADRWNHKIRKLDTTGVVSTIAGTGSVGSRNGPGDQASFYEPWGIAADSIGNLYIADTRGNLIRHIDTSGFVSTFAGTGTYGVVNGPRLSAQFANPTGIAIGLNGELFIADHLGHTIRKIDLNTGQVVTLAGSPFVEGDQDGAGNVATFYRPYGIEVDFAGNVIVADEWNHKIRKVTPAGVTTTIAGDGFLGSDDGPAGFARFNFPWDVVSDELGNIYVMDGFNHIIRKIDSTGQVSSYAGKAASSGAMDGIGIAARFNGATGITREHRTGDLIIADAYNNLIRRVSDTTNLSNDLHIEVAGDPFQDGDTICVDDTQLFSAAPATFSQYDFFVNDVFKQSGPDAEFLYTFNSPGPQEVRIMSFLSNGQPVQSDTFHLFVVEDPSISFTYIAALDTSAGGYVVDFSTTYYQGATYLWTFGDTTSGGAAHTSNEQNPQHVYPYEDTFTVKLLVTDAFSCADYLTHSLQIIYIDTTGTDTTGNGGGGTGGGDNGGGTSIDSVLANANLFIPSAFTPNGDGMNDILYVRGQGIATMDFSVFNEWGELVFRSGNQNAGWDGTYHGKPVQADTYQCVVRLTFVDGTPYIYATKTTLLR